MKKNPPKNSPSPFYKGQRAPSVDFDDVRDSSRSMPAYIDVDLSAARSAAAGTGLMLNISGNSFYIDQRSGSGFAAIVFQDKFNVRPTPITVYPGFVARIAYTQVIIENIAQPGLVLRIVYGTDIDFVPASAAGVSVVNTVSVVDASNTRTAQGFAFMGHSGVSAGVGAYALAQLFNPAASPINVCVEQVIISSNQDGAASMGHYDTALTLINNAKSKLVGGTPSVAELRGQASGGIGMTAPSYLSVRMLASTSAMPINFHEPFVLRPGRGLIVAFFNVGVAVDLSVSWEFFEVAA